MQIKTAILAGVLVAGLPVAAQAQNIESYDNLQVSCETGVECNNFDVMYGQSEGDDEIAQRTRTRRTRRRGSDQKIYAGGTLGIFFPSEVENTFIDPDTGFGGSVYGGYKFTDLISADAEIVLAFGGNDAEIINQNLVTEEIDGSYTLFGFFLNPRFTYSFNQNSERSPYIFASPGIGIGSISFGDDLGDELEDDSGSGFAIQGKVGIGYPITNSIDIVGQARYLNIFNVVEVPEDDVIQIGEPIETEEEGIDAFAIEIGANFKF